MDPKAQKWYGIVAAAVVVIAALGWYFAAHHKASAPSVSNSTATTTSTTSASGGGNAGPNSSVGSAVPDQSTLQKPDLNRPYKPLSTLPQSVQDNNKKLYATAVQQLKIDPNGIAYWLQLAQLRKGANDFSGAAEVWIYVTKRWPNDPIAFENLGDLYANYMHEAALGVEYWQKALPLDAKNIGLYINLATYQDINMHDKAAAQATLEAGLKANPGNTDLQYALDHLQ